MIDIISGMDTDTGAIASKKKGSKAGVWVGLCLVVLAAAGGIYWQKSHSTPAVVAVPEQQPATAVKAADAQWSKSAQARDLAGVLSYYSSDAVVLPANQEMLMNKGDITKAWTAMLDPGNTISWTSMYTEASKSGEMVYDVGSYTMVTQVKKGKPVTDHGKYLAVWKKQADGSWKAVADTWNSDAPVKK
jgi:ketosteroid isomerase-like protein